MIFKFSVSGINFLGRKSLFIINISTIIIIAHFKSCMLLSQPYFEIGYQSETGTLELVKHI